MSNEKHLEHGLPQRQSNRYTLQNNARRCKCKPGSGEGRRLPAAAERAPSECGVLRFADCACHRPRVSV
jgi:hypothetical protein